MKILVFHLGVLLALSLAGRAQVRPLPAPVTTFYSADLQRTALPDSTSYCAEVVYRDSVSGVLRLYYASGNLKQYTPYANVARRIVHGTVSNWYENGSMRTKDDYVRGVRQGELLTYYPDGTPKRRDTYVNGTAQMGSCYDPDGQPAPYFSYEQLPLYPGGEAELTKELQRGLRLTGNELSAMRRDSYRAQVLLQQNWQREVQVQLAVALDGRVTGARVVHSTAGFLNAAALRAVGTLTRHFVPARRDGQAVLSYLTVPLYYSVVPAYQPRHDSGRRPQRY